MAFIHF